MSYAQTHVEWLDCQKAHLNGYPTFMSEESITWLENTVRQFIDNCAAKKYSPALWEIVHHWTRLPERPNDLLFYLTDALNGVTHRALLAVARPCWTTDDGLALTARKPYTLTFNHLTANRCSKPTLEHTIEFRLYDIDNVLYFTGMMSPGLYGSQYITWPLDTARESWGCTRLDCRNPKTEKWETI